MKLQYGTGLESFRGGGAEGQALVVIMMVGFHEVGSVAARVSVNPEWEDTAYLPVDDTAHILRLLLYDHRPEGPQDGGFVGIAECSLHELVHEDSRLHNIPFNPPFQGSIEFVTQIALPTKCRLSAKSFETEGCDLKPSPLWPWGRATTAPLSDPEAVKGWEELCGLLQPTDPAELAAGEDEMDPNPNPNPNPNPVPNPKLNWRTKWTGRRRVRHRGSPWNTPMATAAPPGRGASSWQGLGR